MEMALEMILRELAPEMALWRRATPKGATPEMAAREVSLAWCRGHPRGPPGVARRLRVIGEWWTGGSVGLRAEDAHAAADFRWCSEVVQAFGRRVVGGLRLMWPEGSSGG